MKITRNLPCFPSFHKYNTEMLKAVYSFNQRITSNDILFEEVPCLCKNEVFALIASADRYGLIQSTVICNRCGLVQSNPRMTPECYRVFYESDEYRRLYDGSAFDYEKFYTSGRGNSIYETLLRHKQLKKSDSVLEIGSGGVEPTTIHRKGPVRAWI